MRARKVGCFPIPSDQHQFRRGDHENGSDFPCAGSTGRRPLVAPKALSCAACAAEATKMHGHGVPKRMVKVQMVIMRSNRTSRKQGPMVTSFRHYHAKGLCPVLNGRDQTCCLASPSLAGKSGEWTVLAESLVSPDELGVDHEHLNRRGGFMPFAGCPATGLWPATLQME